MPASAHEWIASASIDEFRASANAMNLVAAMPVLASSAATTARVPPSPAMAETLASRRSLLRHGLLAAASSATATSTASSTATAIWSACAGAPDSCTASLTCFSAKAKGSTAWVSTLATGGQASSSESPAAARVVTGSESAACSSAQPMKPAYSAPMTAKPWNR